jgi:hypothetical protein
MAISKYTNIEQINSRIENEGKFLKPEDIFVTTKGELEISEFGQSKYDVMEVSVYDVNNNLLPQKSGKNVAYIKSGDIKNYVYNITNKGGQKELGIDAQKLLTNLGFSNGILKININFVRNRVGNDNDYSRVWIQEISATREEVRVLPLKVKDQTLTNKVKEELDRTIAQDKDFNLVKKWILDSLDTFYTANLYKINDGITAKFGNDFFFLIKKDFGVSSFDVFRDRIFENFKTSVTHYLNNKYYDIEQSNFGKKLSIPTFDDSERYDFQIINAELQKILYKCVSLQIKTLKRRNIEYQILPEEFSVVQLQKSIKNNLEDVQIPVSNRTDIYSSTLAQIRSRNATAVTPVPTPIESPRVVIRGLEPDIPPGPPYRPENPPVVEPDPIEQPIETPPVNPVIREPEPNPPIIIEPREITLPPGGGGGGAGSPVIIRTPSTIGGGGDSFGDRMGGGDDTISQLER